VYLSEAQLGTTDTTKMVVHRQHVKAESGIILASRWLSNNHNRHQPPSNSTDTFRSAAGQRHPCSRVGQVLAIVDSRKMVVHRQHVTAVERDAQPAGCSPATTPNTMPPAPAVLDHLLVNVAGAVGSDRCEWLSIVAGQSIVHRQHGTAVERDAQPAGCTPAATRTSSLQPATSNHQPQLHRHHHVSVTHGPVSVVCRTTYQERRQRQRGDAGPVTLQPSRNSGRGCTGTVTGRPGSTVSNDRCCSGNQ
jgi:hypothetical protein